MGDVYSTQPSADGFKTIIDFDAYLDSLHNKLTGRRYKLVKAGKIKLADGTEQDQYINQLQDADSKIQPVDDSGADYIVGEISEFMNKHTAMSNLHNDQRCRRLAADITNNIVAEIASSPSTYGCDQSKFGMLGFRMRNVQRSLYLFFLALLNGAILDMGKATTGSQTIIRPDSGDQNSTGIQRVQNR